MDGHLGLDRAALDRARLSRDPRFDGRFFIAVTTTGIYCRPICPSPTSNAANVRYFSSAEAAAEAGFRPCLRCRPEAAPGSSAWLGTLAVVRRALRLIQEGLLDGGSVDALARRVGIGPRHLHRLFLRHVGASPITVAQTRRLQFAKHLLDETDLPITEIALAAGYGSIRRFNDAIQRTYQRTPSELRRRRSSGPASQGHEVALRLAFRPPYDWPQVSGFLAARALPGVERVDARGYARALASEGGHALVSVRPLPGESALELRIQGAAPAELFRISLTVRRCFDLSADPARIALAFEADPLLGPLVRQRPGLRIPGAWDTFECAVLAVLGQDSSPAAAQALAARLIPRAGRAIPETAGLTHLFPSTAELATADLGGLGMSGARVGALRALARAVAGGGLDLGAPADELTSALAALPGFGPRTAQYVALRALGEPDAFPAEAALEARAEAWRPWRGYAVLHLWVEASRAAEALVSSAAYYALRAADTAERA
jgi:AraC family transcriptional regulator, regulatory protein of adaptative response / DNA-3-methyladenine glycosylase II